MSWFRVKCRGFLGNIRRDFSTEERAEQWARQAGVHYSAQIIELTPEASARAAALANTENEKRAHT